MLRQLPNTLTAMRLASVPVLAASLIYGHATLALVVFIFAGLSDAADGFLAKRYGFVTSLGRYLDPVADKLLMLACFLALTAVSASPAYLTSIVVARDIAIVGAILAARWLSLPLRVEPLPIGKFCTAIQVAYVALVLCFLSFQIDRPRVLAAASLVVAAITIASWFAYAILWLRALSARYYSA